MGNVLAADYQRAAHVTAPDQLVHHHDRREHAGARVAQIEGERVVQAELAAQHGGGCGLDVVDKRRILLRNVGRDDQVDIRCAMARRRQTPGYRVARQIDGKLGLAGHAPAANAGQALQGSSTRRRQPLTTSVVVTSRSGRYTPMLSTLVFAVTLRLCAGAKSCSTAISLAGAPGANPPLRHDSMGRRRKRTAVPRWRAPRAPVDRGGSTCVVWRARSAAHV